jgi:hypothetical protein
MPVGERGPGVEANQGEFAGVIKTQPLSLKQLRTGWQVCRLIIQADHPSCMFKCVVMPYSPRARPSKRLRKNYADGGT